MGGKPLISDLVGLAKPTTKLIEVVSNAIGILYEPKRIRNNADAEAYKIEKIASAAKANSISGIIDLSDGKFQINVGEYDSESVSLMVKNEVKRIVEENNNILKIADISYDYLIDDDNEINNEIDEDWKRTFFDKARKVYSEDLQLIFGKILAGEIKKPGKYSKRVLNVLSNLSQTEALIFEKVSKLVFSDGKNSFIVSDVDILNDYDVTLEDIMILEEAGLINSNPLNVSGTEVYEHNNYLVNIHDKNKKINVYILTKVGEELESILMNDFNISYFNRIKEKYKIEKMEYSKIILKRKSGNSTNYNLNNTISI